MTPKRITWRALEHHHGDKSDDWYWAVGVIAVGGAILAIYFNNILFALVILLGAFVAILQSHTEPRILDFEINRRGVKVGETLYPFSTLESFWVIDESIDERDRIVLKSEKIFMPYVIIPYSSAEIEPDDIRDYLIEYLDEEEMDEPALQKIMEKLGF